MSYHQGYPMPGAMMPVESPMAPWMGMAGGYPVYPANMYPQAYLDEMQNERDMKKMKELYPEVAKDVLSVVEDECDQMEYDGSMMFDEYPDKVMFERIKTGFMIRFRRNIRSKRRMTGSGDGHAAGGKETLSAA